MPVSNFYRLRTKNLTDLQTAEEQLELAEDLTTDPVVAQHLREGLDHVRRAITTTMVMQLEGPESPL